MDNMSVIVGIIGETGSGKTTLVKEIHKNLGGIIIDGDKVGHLVLERPEIIDRLVERYGVQILINHQISRNMLGDIVFNDLKELAFLNQLVHPYIKDEILRKIASNYDEPYIFIDGAVLIDANIDQLCTLVIYIKVDEKTRLHRLINGRKIPPKKAKAMIKSQKSAAYFENSADITYEIKDSDTFPMEKLLELLRSQHETHKI